MYYYIYAIYCFVYFINDKTYFQQKRFRCFPFWIISLFLKKYKYPLLCLGLHNTHCFLTKEYGFSLSSFAWSYFEVSRCWKINNVRVLTSTTGSLLVVIPPVTPIFPSGPWDIVSCNVRFTPENSIQYRSRLATARVYFPIFRNRTGLCFK